MTRTRSKNAEVTKMTAADREQDLVRRAGKVRKALEFLTDDERKGVLRTALVELDHTPRS